ncbi:MAG TPA: efflux RND transporter periplasmic adaptor subunit [Nitrospiria bacterium]|nr:efflux RND transporter periplasmic adaptor subunit [Candidatus Manganitrophaceae bacterium]HIL34111.1 efflux RND transporter periplasmic adaptor subunit [Candidatus Manganitrophaceae bacterium]
MTLTMQKQRQIGVKTVTVTQKALETVIRTIGRVDYDETTLTTITTKIEGWIENLSVDTTGMRVTKGKALFSVYSPKLVQTQEEYLLARQASKKTKVKQGLGGLAAASRRRLLLWDVTPRQIRDLEARGKIVRALPILSPVGGVVIEKMALRGMYVKPGMPLYKIADLSQVWIYVDIYESDLPLIKVGQEATVTLSYLPGERFQGKVTTIYPYLNETNRTATVRIILDNADGKLKPGMYAHVEITAPVTTGLAVPESAILDSGLRQIAFVAKPRGVFEPRVVKIGSRINRDIIILEGLKEGEKVVTHGTFLLDSESKMMASMEGMMGLIGMGDWKMEGSKMGEMDMGGMEMKGMPGMDMKGMNMQGKEMEGMRDD